MRICFKAALVTAFIACVSTVSQASESCYRRDDRLAQAGIGLGMYFGYGSIFFPPLSAVVDYGASDLVSIGAGIGFLGSRVVDSHGDVLLNYSCFPLMGRVAFHPFNLPGLQSAIPVRDQFDAYGGLSLGYTFISYAEVTDYSSTTYIVGGSYVTWGLLLGGRWFFSPNWALYAEEGSGFGWLSVGVTTRF